MEMPLDERESSNRPVPENETISRVKRNYSFQYTYIISALLLVNTVLILSVSPLVCVISILLNIFNICAHYIEFSYNLFLYQNRIIKYNVKDIIDHTLINI